MKLMRKKLNKRGFSLIELIVVIAILAIIAAVAIPRFAGIQERSTIKADAATAAEIINAARIQHTDENDAVTDDTGADLPDVSVLKADYMTVPASPQSEPGENFTLFYDDGTLSYSVTFTPDGYNEVTITENVEFDYDTDVTK